jgi:type IV secretion system protein TrbI
MSFEPSPDILQSPPTRGAGVRRLNRVPLFIAMMILAALLGVVAYTYYQRAHQSQGESKSDDSPIELNNPRL